MWFYEVDRYLSSSFQAFFDSTAHMDVGVLSGTKSRMAQEDVTAQVQRYLIEIHRDVSRPSNWRAC